MPDKTQAELIRDVRESMAFFRGSVERDLETMRDWIDQLNKVQDRVNEIDRKVVLLEHQVSESKKEAEESKRWHRSLIGPIIAAVIGSTLTALLGLLIYLLQR